MVVLLYHLLLLLNDLYLFQKQQNNIGVVSFMALLLSYSFLFLLSFIVHVFIRHTGMNQVDVLISISNL
jgi:hypothetical protein